MSTERPARLLLSTTLLLSGLLGGCRQDQSGSTTVSPEDFYKDKLVTIVVPFNPGGGFDQYPRLAQAVLQKNLPGTSVIVQNRPGAGGIVGTNHLYRVKPDGLTLGFCNIAGLVFATVTSEPGVAYDINKFSWIGRVYAEPRALIVSARSPVNSIDDLRKLGRPVKMSTTGIGSDDYYLGLILFKALGLPLLSAAGYGGSQESNLAVLRGEVDCTLSSLSAVESGIVAGELKLIFLLAESPVKGYEKVPLARDLVEESQRGILEAILHVIALERSFVGPPGIPPERLAYLRQAFDKTFSDPEVVDRLRKAKRGVEWLNGRGCEERISDVMTAGQSLAKDLIGFQH
jgi:tripartite-type tricarboxylate transporter receptor subunit TctC